MMKKSKLNLIIDAILLLCMAAIAGIGLLMKNVLVPGYKRWDIYGRNVELYFWGLDCHQWGTIHFIIELVLLALLVLHIALHWSMILGIYRKLIPNPRTRPWSRSWSTIRISHSTERKVYASESTPQVRSVAGSCRC